MRQRVALMRTLIARPEILLMDEPFGALDTHTKLEMHRVLLQLWERERQTVLFVTHDLGEALTLADRIILLSARPGRVKEDFEVDFPRPRDAVALRESREFAGCSPISGIRSAKNSARRRRSETYEPRNLRRLSCSGRSRSGSAAACRLAMGLRPAGDAAAMRYVPDFLDPYFVSKPSEIFKSFLRLGCLTDRGAYAPRLERHDGVPCRGCQQHLDGDRR